MPGTTEPFVCGEALRLFARTYASPNLTGLGPEESVIRSWPTQLRSEPT